VTCDVVGQLRGVEAVIDEDLEIEVVARELHADAMLLQTDGVGVFSEYATSER
jgi:carbamate kinase